MRNRTYISIDLKSFYASVECRERGLDPMKANLVVADMSRTEKTICLAVSPALKSFGIPGRPRLFEVIQRVKEVNVMRRQKLSGGGFDGVSTDFDQLEENPNLAVDYIVAQPRMAHYLEYSTKIYQVYMKYISPDDMHVYSIDEVFIDATPYLKTYGMTAEQLARTIIKDVLDTTGITATAGIGSNLYLCKIAMDVVAKHTEADEYGVRIAELDEMSYRRTLWNHRPLTDFWRVGKGYAKKLEKQGIYTMGDIARCSIGGDDDYYNEELLYKMFGVNAELLIDHAWGWEPCTISDIKGYRPSTNSICSGQVLQEAYTYEKTRLVVREMADLMALDLTEKGLVTDQIVLTIGYDIENLMDPGRRERYDGEITTDAYGRKIPKHAHGTANLDRYTASTKAITDAVVELYDKITDEHLLVRRLNLTANRVVRSDSIGKEQHTEQLSFFSDYGHEVSGTNLTTKAAEEEDQKRESEMAVQKAMLSIKKKFGKNAILKGMNLEEGATAKDRNSQIGGHRK